MELVTLTPTDLPIAADDTTDGAEPPLRIQEVADQVGLTTRSIRYYEEIGLLPDGEARMAGSHRLYEQADLDRLLDAMRLKSRLAVSLDELKELLAAEDARAALRHELSRAAFEP